jgi:Tfp pilus assembly protein PilF
MLLVISFFLGKMANPIVDRAAHEPTYRLPGKLLDGPRDNALLRFSLGNEYLKAGDLARASVYFRAAIERDPNYSAGWKALGKTLAEAGERAAALAVYEQGISVAESRSDIQAAREMKVFARRIRVSQSP